jgi:hypothetical protein
MAWMATEAMPRTILAIPKSYKSWFRLAGVRKAAAN